ncbi:Crp/Fnr family transcriptional regulator [Kribbella sp. NPDC051586]|uniref:Crp/Fnr family transcriptional regulator n=1 Tax=Kribbella sp. NPDC051586 TaxID=3364118 RepID=UPI00378CB98D
MDDYRLMDVPVFAGLGADVCRDLELRTRIQRVTRGTVLAVEGAPVEQLFVVHAGQVAAYRHAESGRQAHVRTDTAPVVIDKATAIAATNQLFTWTVIEDAVIRYLPREIFVELFQTEASVALQTALHLATQANRVRTDYLTAATDSAPQRVLQRLKLLADHTGSARLPNGQSGLADELGLTRVTVSRALRHLVDAGQVTVRGKDIRLS